jgi:ATP-binding cassette subfamily B protein
MLFPTFKQQFKMDCGPSCLKIVLTYYKINYSIHQIREYFDDLNKGTSLLQISSVAERLGFKAQGEWHLYSCLITEALFCDNNMA